MIFIMQRPSNIITILLLVFALFSTLAGAQPTSLTITEDDFFQTGDRLFRIGFLKADVEPLLDESLFQNLKRHFEKDNDLMNELSADGFKGIAVIPVDGFIDMVRRMNHNEFDLVFCSSTVYVRQEGDYSAILQVRRLRDSWDTRGGGKVFQKGALIMSAKRMSQMGQDPDKETVATFLRNARIAVVSSYSAPGYLFPLRKIKKDYNVSPAEALIFCDSSEEVVKYVISGLADAGCCERGAVDDVLKDTRLNVQKKDLVKVLFETEPIPTNPVVIRSQLHPRTSTAGRTVKDALRAFFSTLPPSMPRLENSRDEYFTNLQEALSTLDLKGY
jgi:ABC-type phosphate/phosphonate transport system substrate-binding protein